MTLKNLGSIFYGKRQIHYSSNNEYINITIANITDNLAAICLLWQNNKLSGNYLNKISKKLQKFIITNIPLQ
jgi:hypothetical protein